MIVYFGDGAYCYSNCTAMLLSSIGENISPSKIEVLTGIGIGAFLQKNAFKIFFSPLSTAPDTGINQALNILGFSIKEDISREGEPAPFDKLIQDLKISPVILGALDMGYLTYNPLHKFLVGVDHYVIAYEFNNGEIKFHDPAGFPSMSLNFQDFELAWKAENISYRRGNYCSWTLPKRISSPSEKEIFEKVVTFFIKVYLQSEEQAKKENRLFGHLAIKSLSKHISTDNLSEIEQNHLVNFALPLAARRALDYSLFFESKDKELAKLKQLQSEEFGKSHVLAMKKDYHSLMKELQLLADIEEQFRNRLLKKYS